MHIDNVVILTSETAVSVDFFSSSPSWSVGLSIQAKDIDVVRSSPKGAHYQLAPFTVNKEGGKMLMVLLVRPTPTLFPTNILYAPVNSSTM